MIGPNHFISHIINASVAPHNLHMQLYSNYGAACAATHMNTSVASMHKCHQILLEIPQFM